MKGTILIIEDYDINRMITTTLLEEAGFLVVGAQNAEMGIQLAAQHNPALILMDLHLPGKDGFEATQTLRAKPEFTNTPIIAFTALVMDGDKQKALAAGCNDVLSKPIDIYSFAKTIEQYIVEFKTA